MVAQGAPPAPITDAELEARVRNIRALAESHERFVQTRIDEQRRQLALLRTPSPLKKRDADAQPQPPSPALPQQGTRPHAVLGYDTDGDGRLDAFDTNQDGDIDTRATISTESADGATPAQQLSSQWVLQHNAVAPASTAEPQTPPHDETLPNPDNDKFSRTLQQTIVSLQHAREENRQCRLEVVKWQKMHALKDGQVKLAEQSNLELQELIAAQDEQLKRAIESSSQNREVAKFQEANRQLVNKLHAAEQAMDQLRSERDARAHELEENAHELEENAHELEELRQHTANAGQVIQQQRTALKTLGAQVDGLEKGLTEIMAEKETAVAKCECLSEALSEVEEQLSMLKSRWSQYRSDVEAEMALLDSHIGTSCKVAAAALAEAPAARTTAVAPVVDNQLDDTNTSQMVLFDGHSDNGSSAASDSGQEDEESQYPDVPEHELTTGSRHRAKFGPRASSSPSDRRDSTVSATIETDLSPVMPQRAESSDFGLNASKSHLSPIPHGPRVRNRTSPDSSRLRPPAALHTNESKAASLVNSHGEECSLEANEFADAVDSTEANHEANGTHSTERSELSNELAAPDRASAFTRLAPTLAVGLRDASYAPAGVEYDQDPASGTNSSAVLSPAPMAHQVTDESLFAELNREEAARMEMQQFSARSSEEGDSDCYEECMDKDSEVVQNLERTMVMADAMGADQAGKQQVAEGESLEELQAELETMREKYSRIKTKYMRQSHIHSEVNKVLLSLERDECSVSDVSSIASSGDVRELVQPWLAQTHPVDNSLKDQIKQALANTLMADGAAPMDVSNDTVIGVDTREMRPSNVDGFHGIYHKFSHAIMEHDKNNSNKHNKDEESVVGEPKSEQVTPPRSAHSRGGMRTKRNDASKSSNTTNSAGNRKRSPLQNTTNKPPRKSIVGAGAVADAAIVKATPSRAASGRGVRSTALEKQQQASGGSNRIRSSRRRSANVSNENGFTGARSESYVDGRGKPTVRSKRMPAPNSSQSLRRPTQLKASVRAQLPAVQIET
eukprot:SAG31_NODE_320_length_17748_cov_4.201881_3_plen_1022_part_00